MEPITETEVPTGFDEITAPNLVIFTLSGSCVVFPDVRAFIKDNGAEALLVDEDDNVHLLKKGLKKNTMQWVMMTEEYETK